MTKNIIIGTAGHIDHGKSTLIKALTGEDTDRLAEEKERGISIELGFSHLENRETLARQLNLGIVDVPGHQKFVNKMLAAAGGIDLALIVIAADEGVMPQTQEHLAILELMDIKKPLIVITKIDLVDSEWLELIKLDIIDQFSGTFAENAEMLEVSAVEKRGIDKLKSKIIELAAALENNQEGEIPYYPIDRIFSLKGQGTIVTGTLFKGQLCQGDELQLYPGGKKTKIKSLESHQQKLKKVNCGSRVGINLSYPDKNEIKQGDVISAVDSLISSKFFEGELKILDSINFKLKNGDRIHFHSGTTEVTGTVYLYGQKEAFPGEKLFVKIKLDQKISLYYRQKYVIRRFSPLETIGGGEILELDPPPRRKKDSKKLIAELNLLKKADKLKALELFIKNEKNTAVEVKLLKKKTALKKEVILTALLKLEEEGIIFNLETNKSFIHRDNLEILKDKILNILENYHQQYRLKAGMSKEEIRSRLDFDLSKKELDRVLDILYRQEVLLEKNGLIAKYQFKVKLTKEEKKQKEFILNKIRKNLFSPPGRAEFLKENEEIAAMIDYLEAESKLIRLTDDLYFDRAVFPKIREYLQEYFKENESIELAEFRDLIGSSRRYALVLLEKCDQLQITVRDGDQRYPGKNL